MIMLNSCNHSIRCTASTLCVLFEGGEVEEGVTPLLRHEWTWNGAEGMNLLSPCVSPSAADKQSWRAVLIRVHGRWVGEVEEG